MFKGFNSKNLICRSWNSEDTSISPDPSDTNCGTKFYSFANGKNTEKKPNFSNLITNISEGHSMLCSQPHNNTKINLHTMCVNISNKGKQLYNIFPNLFVQNIKLGPRLVLDFYKYVKLSNLNLFI